MKAWVSLVLALAATLAPGLARAHPMEFGVLGLRERADGDFDLELRFSGGEEAPTSGAPWLDEGCRLDDALQVPLDWGIHLRGTLRCEGGVPGKRIGVRGLEGTDVDVQLQVRFGARVADGATDSADETVGGSFVALLDADTPRAVVRRPERPLAIAGRYVGIGVEHIALGVDHLLLVLGLLLASRGRRELVLTITGFTLGHSVTLALAVLDLVRLPVAPVEATIALSLVVLAADLVRADRAAENRSAPTVIAVVFGLLHGLGFAGALADVGLPSHAVGSALLGFNVGVELGQLAFVAVAILVAKAAMRVVGTARADAWRVLVPQAIGAAATYFLWQRLLSLGA